MGARCVGEPSALTESETRTALEEAGYEAILWRDDTEVALDMATQGQTGPNLGLVMGPDFPAMISNLARNLRENRLGVLSAVRIRHCSLWRGGELQEVGLQKALRSSYDGRNRLCVEQDVPVASGRTV